MQKVAVHEVGHNRGLRHCSTRLCVMNDAAETVRTIDRVGLLLCEKCHERVLND
jgi:archaemetzincin